MAPLPIAPYLPAALSRCFLPGSLQQKRHTPSRWPLPAGDQLGHSGKAQLCPQEMEGEPTGHSPRKGSWVCAFRRINTAFPVTPIWEAVSSPQSPGLSMQAAKNH